MGFARGSGSLTGRRWTVALGCFITVTTLSISGLLLVGGALNMIAALLGYALGAKRIPWAVLGSIFIVLSILNAGKQDMRSQYWQSDAPSPANASLSSMPGMFVDWFETGIGALGSTQQQGSTLFERTSLLHMVLTVQEVTPTVIPYLEGETYEMLPSMLVPRFLEPNKITSQAALDLLSVRYGREEAGQIGKTTIGWGMVAEAYANYGNIAVIVVGIVFGMLCGTLMRLSTMASPASFSMLVAIAATLTLCNLEADFSYTMVTLFQTIVGIALFAALPRFTRARPTRPIQRTPRAVL
jgi:hypothetical protein